MNCKKIYPRHLKKAKKLTVTFVTSTKKTSKKHKRQRKQTLSATIDAVNAQHCWRLA